MPVRGSVVLSFVVLALTAGPLQAQTGRAADARYPAKPVRLVSTFAPGGGASTVARMIAPGMGEGLGQPIVIDHRPGAGGAIGSELAARAQPDGYTLVIGTASTAVINPLVTKVPFDPVRDFSPIVHISTVPLVLVVHPSVPVKSVSELVSHAKAQRTQLNFSSSGEGTLTHLASELLKKSAGFDMVHVPYKGGGLAIIDLMAGHVQTGFLNILEALPQINAGRLRALAVSTPARSTAAPAIPTVAESGVPGFAVIQWAGILGPAGVPRAVIMKVNAEVNRVISRPDMRERLVGAGAEPAGGTPDQFAALIRSDIAKWSGVVKSIGLAAKR